MRSRWISSPIAYEPITVRAPEDQIANLLGYWRASNVTGSPATTLADLSGNGRTMTSSGLTLSSTSSARRWTRTGVALFDIAAGNRAATAAGGKAAWKPLHDGTGVSLWTVVNPDVLSSQQILLSTYDGSSSQVGFSLHVDTTFQRVVYTVINGDSQGACFTCATWQGSVPNGQPTAVLVTFDTDESPACKIYINGQLASAANLGNKAQDGVGRALSSANPNNALTLGGLATDPSSPYDGQVAEVGVVSGVVTATERAALMAYEADRYGIGANGHKAIELLCDGNSIVDESWRSYGVFPHDIPTSLRRPVYPLNMGVSGLDLDEMTNVTRFARHVTAHYDPTRALNIYFPYEFTNQLTHDTAAGAYAKYVALCQAARAVGFTVVAQPMLPVRDGTITQAQFDAVNALVVAGWPTFASAISRFDQDPLFTWAGGLNTTYFPDFKHPSAAALAVKVPYDVVAINSTLPL